MADSSRDLDARAARVRALSSQVDVAMAVGDRPLALTYARQALELETSPENLALVAQVLMAVPPGQQPSPADVEEAKGLVTVAVQMDPNNADAQNAAVTVALTTRDTEMLRNAVARLEAVDARSPNTHVLRAVLAATERNWPEANAALDRALALGLPKEQYEALRKKFAGSRPFYVRWQKPAVIAVGAWFAVFALLLAAGAVLSWMALRTAREMRHDGQVAGLSGGVRRAYAAVLMLCCTFYYASIPIVMLLVLGITGALLYGAYALGHVPVKLLGLIVAVAGVSLWSMVKGLFIRVRDYDPGLRLDLAREPKLRALLDDVAMQIGTRAVDNVYLTPGTEVAVMERGKRKAKERCLILGVAALDGFALRPFKAVLGHEYGHFTNRDTAGGAYALAVRSSLHATAYALARGGAAVWYSPAWLFINGFHRVFMRISQGASRLQEVLADRWAVFAYGADAFERGLRHVVERSVRFNEHMGATLKEVVDGKVPLANLYTYTPAKPAERVAKAVADAVNESINRKASPYDSHPSPCERFELAHALPRRAHGVEPDDEGPVWSIFTNPDALQHAMTAQVRASIKAKYGVEILAPAPV